MVDSLFDLNNIQLQNNKQVERTQTRQHKEVQVAQRRQDLTLAGAEKARAINEQSMQSAEATRSQQLGVMNGIQEELRRAQEAQALAQSDNPLDRVKLWALQQTSDSYNREGNQARINWHVNAAQAVGYGETIRQQGFADQLGAIQQEIEYTMAADNADLDMLTLMETQGTQLIDAYRQSQSNTLEYLRTQNAMQDAALENVSDPVVLKDALTEARNSPSGTVSIGGVELTAAKVESRIAAAEEISFNRTSRQLIAQDNILKTLTLDQLAPYEVEARQSPDGVAVIDGITVPLAQIDQRRGALKNMTAQEMAMDLQSATMLTQLDTQAQERIVRNMSVGQLNELIQVHKGIDPETGQMYDMTMLRGWRDEKAVEQTDQMNTQSTLMQNSNPIKTASDVQAGFEAIPAAPGSALASVIQKQSQLVNQMASESFLGSDDTMSQLFGMQIVEQARQNVESAISTEAKFMAAGDKDLETAYNYQLRGMPVPAELVSTAVAELAKKNLPKDQWLTSGPSGTLSVYNRTYEESRRSMSDPSTKAMSGMTSSEIDVEAHRMAMEAVKAKAAQGMTENLVTFQLGDTTNPLHGKVGESQLLVMMKEADMSGAQAFQQASGTSEEDMAALLSGAKADPDLAAIQQSHFLMKLEEMQAGLSDQYLTWWNSPARTQRYSQFDQAMSANSNSTFQQAAQWGLIRQDIPHMLTASAMTLEQGRNVVMADQIRAQHQQYVTFGAKPENQQAFLLEQDRNLTGSDKQAIMTRIIAPILQDAARQQLNYQDTTVFLENQLQYLQPEDPAIKKLYTRLMSGRDGSIRILEDFIKTNQHLNHPFLEWNNGLSLSNNLDTTFDRQFTNLNAENGFKPSNMAIGNPHAKSSGLPQLAPTYPWMAN